MVTIKDVARLAGVSTATVSLVTNPSSQLKYRVSEDSKEKVLRAVGQLNYRPNKIAQGLLSRQTKVIGLVLPSIEDPFFPAVALAIETELRQHDYQLLLSHSSGSDTIEKARIEDLKSWSVSGIIAAPAQETGDPRAFWDLHDSEVPFVLVDRTYDGTPFHSVVTDDEAGASQATAHLISLGHREIVMMLGRSGLYSVRQRLQGYTRTMIEHGLVPRTAITTTRDESREGAHATTLSLLRSDAKPTAVFCVSDLIALGVMKAVFEIGMRIPEDLALVGFGDLPNADMLRISLTTVSQPKAEIGMEAAKMILRRMTDANAGETPTQVKLPCSLIVRESCGSGLP